MHTLRSGVFERSRATRVRDRNEADADLNLYKLPPELTIFARRFANCSRNWLGFTRRDGARENFCWSSVR